MTQAHTDPGPTIEGIRWMLEDADMRWTQVAAITGVDRTTLMRTYTHEKGVAKGTERAVLESVQRIKRSPWLRERDALTFPSDWTRWQYHTLSARGWTKADIEARVGINKPRRGSRVLRRTMDAYDALFAEWHDQWGTSRRTAVLSWRKGYLPSDCYLWEEGDTRPIPGSMHPDLVVEAATYAHNAPKHRSREVLALLEGVGQWADPTCARTAHRTWAKHMGLPDEEYGDLPFDPSVGRPKLWCRHEHAVPRIWKT